MIRLGVVSFFGIHLGICLYSDGLPSKNNNMNRIENDVTTKPGITSEVRHFSIKNDSIQLKLNWV